MEEIRGRAESRVLKITALLESDATPFDMPQKRLASTRTFIDVLDGHKALLVGAKDGEERMGVEDFGLFVQSLGLSKYPYIGGAAPRTNIPVLGNSLSRTTIFSSTSTFLMSLTLLSSSLCCFQLGPSRDTFHGTQLILGSW